jgi:hypothetical protein
MSLNTFNMARDDGSVAVEDVEGPGNAEGWENVEQDNDFEDDNVNAAMKRGRMKKHPVSIAILKDILGVDGDLAMVNEAKRHEKNKAQKKRPFEMIEVACIHFDSMMAKKCKLLEEDTKLAKEGKYKSMNYDWIGEYDEEVKESD